MNAPRLPLTAWVLQMPDNKPLAVGFNVPFKEAIAATKARGVVLPEKYYGELQGIHRALNYSIAGVASLDQLQAVLNSHEDALKNGTTFKEWQNDVRVQDLGLSKARLDNIYRTNIQSAYNRGRWEQYVENKANRPYLMYDAINDSRVRPSHLAMDGIIRPVGDSFWDTNYPTNGFRCRCRCISLSQSQAAQRSKNGTGLNQKITPEMKPDKGWDYNVGEDLTVGIEQAVEQRLADERIARQLKSALNDKLVKNQQIPLAQQEKFLNDYRETHGSIVDSVERDLLGIETAKKYGLTHPETVMLNAYAQSGYIDINKLHNGLETFDEKTTQTLENASKILSQALSKLPNFDDTVRRSVNYSADVIAKHEIGEIMNYGGFTSATYIEEDVFHDSTRLIIKSKTSKVIETFSPHEEFEALIDKNTKFEVRGKKIIGTGYDKVTEIELWEI